MSRHLAKSVLILFALTSFVRAEIPAVRSGDLVLTRNVDSVGNPNGYFNHVAIVVAVPFRGIAVVEMQQEFDTAIAVTGEAFFRRYPEYMIIRHQNALVADRAARFAWTRVGIPKYGALASAKPFVKRNHKENCVSLVRHCYVDAGIFDPRWLKPDGVHRFGGASGFRTVDHFRFENYTVPENFFEGRINP